MSTEDRYDIAETFASIQGEGHWTGTRCLFVRFAGCNLGCAWCDTDHAERYKLSLGKLLHTLDDMREEFITHHVVLTGGEPLLQVDTALLEALDDRTFFVHLETNGTLVPAPGPLDWVAVSPKDLSPMGLARVAHNFEQVGIDELKVVVAPGDPLPEFPWRLIARNGSREAHQFVSPVLPRTVDADTQAAADASIAHARDLVLSRPGWRLMTQAHKTWSAR